MSRGDIILVNLPQPIDGVGHEQIGNRPALVVQDEIAGSTISVIMIIPFTGQITANRFPHTILIQPTLGNGLTSPSVLLVFQLRAIDKRRIIKTIGCLDDQTMELVNTEMRKLLGL
jgi:mRNA interferase MazF